MDKLTVGVMLRPAYKPTVGGGFSYYDTLLHHIDQYKFHDRLNIVFVNIGQPSLSVFDKQIININPLKNYGTRDKIKHKIALFLGKRYVRIFRVFNPLRRSLTKSNSTRYYNYAAEELIKQKVDLLYYLVPGEASLNYPYIMTHWDNGHLSMFSFPEVAMNKTYENRDHYFKTTLAKSFAVFCESGAGKKELVRYTNINPDRIFIVPLFPGNLVRLSVPDSLQSQILDQFGLKPKQYFFYPAQFWSHKNHYNLLIAFKSLRTAFPHLRLVFSGSDKGNLDYIKGVIKSLGLEKEVVVAGFVDHEALFTFYKHAVSLVMPTFLGPTNIPLLEAQAIGCRVICSNLEGHREMLGDSAFYIDPDNPESIAEAMVLCCNDSNECAPAVNSTFNVATAVRQIEANLLSIMPRRKAFGNNFSQF